ncbi:TetR family transcriptional regulator C-terminal domain-containing protein [Haloechinothrix sp. LS1_15]|uniref:TetR/AcrR family transcriptional regulator n=1 Tax=Haloechinothrix sp. LS1_15 TaxID=2652248 RepID=UPI002944768E|nr:TetR family transcriptional regulator C-terminal domain-containing protein [Haloechinothrix sp. LS1_15]MDV6012418.1 TetR family transcriptional regulator [Haloechinothrix sp. LS1_15]
MSARGEPRERIVRRAARLFLSRSYRDVGVDELCAAAEVRKGSFYHFFAGKSDVAKAVIDLHTTALLDRLSRASGATAAERLHGLADAIGTIQTGFEERFGRVVGCPFGNLAAELATTDEDLRTHLANTFAQWEGEFATVCRQAAAEGALRRGVDPDRLARALLAQAQGQILLAKTATEPAAGIAAALHDLIDAHLEEGLAT